MKKIVLVLLIVCLLFLSACYSLVGSRLKMLNEDNDEGKADARLEQIIAAIKNEDKEALKSLFSNKAIDESDDFDGEVDSLLDFIQGDIIAWKRDGWASSESIEYGKKSLMIRPGFKVVTDVEEYMLFLIDFAVDTIDPDNEGVYMLEVSKSSYSGEWDSWQDRMRAGISIVE